MIYLLQRTKLCFVGIFFKLKLSTRFVCKKGKQLQQAFLKLACKGTKKLLGKSLAKSEVIIQNSAKIVEIKK